MSEVHVPPSSTEGGGRGLRDAGEARMSFNKIVGGTRRMKDMEDNVERRQVHQGNFLGEFAEVSSGPDVRTGTCMLHRDDFGDWNFWRHEVRKHDGEQQPQSHQRRHDVVQVVAPVHNMGQHCRRHQEIYIYIYTHMGNLD